MSSFESLSVQELGLMSDRRLLFNDLSAAQKTELLLEVGHENTDEKGKPLQRLDGVATQAFLGSVYGLIYMGAARVRKQTSNVASFYEIDDCIHDFIAHRNLGNVATNFLNANVSITTRIIGETWSFSRRSLESNGHNGMHFPKNIFVSNMKRVAADLEHHTEMTGEEKIGALTGYVLGQYADKARVARDVARFMNVDRIIVEQISLEDEAEKRILVEADLDDDELVGDCNDPSDERDVYGTLANIDEMLTRESDLKDAESTLELVTILPPRDRAVVINYFGLAGETPRTIAKIGRELGLTRSRVGQIVGDMLDFFRDPEGHLSKTKKVSDLKVRYGLMKAGYEVDVAVDYGEVFSTLPIAFSDYMFVARLATLDGPEVSRFRGELPYHQQVLFDLYTGYIGGEALKHKEIQSIFSYDIGPSRKQLQKKINKFYKSQTK